MPLQSAAVSVVAEKARAWAEIDLGALARNLAWLRERAGGRRVIAVVKANGYGHGAVSVSSALVRAGADALAVVTLEEARELRVAGLSAPILLLNGPLTPEQADELLALRVVPTLTTTAQLQAVEAAAGRAGVSATRHEKLDTGMGRLGFRPDGLSPLLDRLRSAPAVMLEGVMSHLAEADDPRSAGTERQRKVFAELVARVRDAGFDPEWVDEPAWREAETVVLPYEVFTEDNGRAPVVTRCKLTFAQDALYFACEAARATRILTLPIGYADGLPRAAGNKLEVGHRGRRVRLVGRVSCDLATVDVGPEAEGEAGDEVLIFGRSRDLEIRVEELAAAVGTISYEVLVRIGDRIPRIPVL